MVRMKSIVATLDFNRDHSTSRIDDEKVNFARTDPIGILNQEILHHDPRRIGKRILKVSAKGQFRRIRWARRALRPDLVGDTRMEDCHDLSVPKCSAPSH